MRVILFRGRNTTRILEDARAAGVLAPDARVEIICRETDDLAQPGDISVSRFHAGNCGDDTVVIANGGTTAQSIRVVATLVAAFEERYWRSAEELVERRSALRMPETTGNLRIIDLQADGLTVRLWG